MRSTHFPMMRSLRTIQWRMISVRRNHPCIDNSVRKFSDKKQSPGEDKNYFVHFRETTNPHPLHIKDRKSTADISGLPHNIWSPEEIKERMNSLYYHKPQTLSDKIMKSILNFLYHSFNLITGYHHDNPTVPAMKRRLIILESVAGVPGFVAAGFRHFRAIRSLNRDFGWIPTLLEEAENERTHLIICLEMFKPSLVVRLLVIAGQYVMTPFLMTVYLIKPKALHRFVGYLEESACNTYVNAIQKIETPGTNLHKEWASLDAPDIAIQYYKLPSSAKWVDVLKCIFADESNHRDVNHTFAGMPSDDPNPFVEKYHSKAAYSWRLNEEGKTSVKELDGNRDEKT